MCQLLGMNCNTPTDICFSFTGFQQRGGGTDVHADGWGIAFFEGKGVRLFLDPQPSAQSTIAELVRNYPIRSLNVIAHIRKATQGAAWSDIASNVDTTTTTAQQIVLTANEIIAAATQYQLYLEGTGSWLQAGTTTLALALLLLGSVARANAPVGGPLPTLALSTLVLAAVVYALPLLSWVLEPAIRRQYRPKPRLRTHP